MDDQSGQQFHSLIQDFVTEVLQQLGLPLMTSEQEANLRELILEKIDRRIVALILDEMSDAHFEELMEKLSERPFTEEEEQMIFAQATERIRDFPKKFTGTLTALREEMMQDAQDLRNLILGKAPGE